MTMKYSKNLKIFIKVIIYILAVSLIPSQSLIGMAAEENSQKKILIWRMEKNLP